MPFDGSGVFQRVRNWVADAAAGIKIRADLHDSEDDGFAAGLSNTITRDGQSTITQNIPFNNKRITGLGDPVNVKDAVNKQYSDGKTDLAFPKTGGTLTGDILIQKMHPAIVLDGTAAGSSNAIHGRLLTKQRWMLRPGNGAPETGGNAGSDFDLHRYADDGSYLGGVLSFSRQTGLGAVAADPTSPLGIATKGYIDTQVAANISGKVNRTGDTMTGNLISPVGLGFGTGGSVGTFEVRGGASAAMSFHCVGAFAANFGMMSDGNFWMGGWSYGEGVVYKFWTTRDFTSLPAGGATNMRVVFVADFALGSIGMMEEPYNGGIITGLQQFAGTPLYAARFRQIQVFIGGTWYSVGYA